MKTNTGQIDTTLSRRTFLMAGIPLVAAISGCNQAGGITIRRGVQVMTVRAVDHLVFGFPDLEGGIDWVEKNLGVRAVFGGVHPGGGTHNALLALGERRYLEVIAPDPAQPGVIGRFGDLRSLTAPKLITWASATASIDDKAGLAVKAGYRTDGPRDGSRARPDGKLMQWKTLSVLSDLGGVIPFFIQWEAGGVHPADDSPAGCRLEDLHFEHPRPDQVITMLGNLGIEARVDSGPDPRIIATLSTPKGRVTLS